MHSPSLSIRDDSNSNRTRYRAARTTEAPTDRFPHFRFVAALFFSFLHARAYYVFYSWCAWRERRKGGGKKCLCRMLAKRAAYRFYCSLQLWIKGFFCSYSFFFYIYFFHAPHIHIGITCVADVGGPLEISARIAMLFCTELYSTLLFSLSLFFAFFFRRGRV